MGVQGLASFVEKHPKVYREVQFNRSRLVIDGCNLNYLLYFGSGLDQNHGGEYAAYENLIERFITALRTCEISPYVVLDGGSDVTDKKVETVAKRTEDRVIRGHIAAVSGRRMSILPRMADLVFRQTLARLQVPVAQCFEEADREIAALAAEWRCPVLSYDSDFYIFDLPGGLLPYAHFHWKKVKQSGSLSFISCRRYYSSSFCIFFGLQPQLLPTFAALAGNDYVKLKVVKWDDFAPPGTETPSRLEGLLCWLKNFEETQEALEAALVLMGVLNENKREVLQRLHLGMEDYQLRPSSLNRFFLHGVPPEFPALDEEADLVPNWMLLPLTQARLSPHILDVLRLHKMGLGFSIEDETLPSANLISRPVRQVLYGLLLGRRKPNLVDEIDRDGLEVTSIEVKPILTRTSKKLVLSSLHKAELSDRLQVLLEALEVTEESLSLLPPELKLPAAVTCYWLQKAQPTPDRTMLKALLLGMCNRSTLKFTAALHKNSSKQRMDISAAYVFNQWQVSLKHSIHLNQLLGFPLPDPRVAELYQGTLVHKLLHKMRSGEKLKPFLKSDKSSEKMYRSLLSVVLKHQAQNLVLASDDHQRVTASQQQRSTQQQKHFLKDLSIDMQQLFLQHQDEETEKEIKAAMEVQQELRLEEEQLLVRTRYRTKERSNRCRNPELARKEDCRGWDLL